MTKSITKTRALRVARQAVSQIICGSDYVFYTPANCGLIHGPKSEVRRATYAQAVAARRLRVADVALAMLQVPSTLDGTEADSAEGLVNHALKHRASSEWALGA